MYHNLFILLLIVLRKFFLLSFHHYKSVAVNTLPWKLVLEFLCGRFLEAVLGSTSQMKYKEMKD